MTRRLRLLIGLATLHTALLIVSTVAGAKLVALPFGLSASATVLSYTLTFVILDTIADLFGAATATFVINMGLAGMVLAAAYLEAAALTPPAQGFTGQEAFAFVLSSSWRIWLAGWCAYSVSQRLDTWVYLTLKKTGVAGHLVATRAWISLLLGQFVDTIIFAGIAFWGETNLLPVIEGQYVVKLVLASVSVPLVSLAVGAARRFMAQDGVAQGETSHVFESS